MTSEAWSLLRAASLSFEGGSAVLFVLPGINALGRHSGTRMLICLLGFGRIRPLVLWLVREIDGDGAARCAPGRARP